MRDDKTMEIDERELVPTVDDEHAMAFAPGSYRLCFEIASGGMATVYLALYEGPANFEKVVAVKTIHEHLAKEQRFLDMFLDEARIAANIEHPYVARVLDFGQAQESWYLAMEYVDGEALSEVFDRLVEDPELAGSLSRARLVARVIADLAEGLHGAHSMTIDGEPMGIVHRDVSPSNLFVCYDGTVRVVDFGIATAEDRLHHTATGMLKGKFAYMSPEQLAMQDLDARSDVFALGTVFWELLTGQRLFRREAPMDTMKAVSEAPIRPASELNDAVPPGLDAIVDKALERDPNLRYQSARELSLAIERYLSSERRSVPKAEVAEWMAQLFPTGAEKRRKLIDLTRKGEAAIQLAEEAGIDYEPTSLYLVPDPTQVRPRERGRESTEPGARPPEQAASAQASRPEADSKPTGVGRAIVTAAFILALGGLGVAAMMLRPWEPRPVAASATAATPTNAHDASAPSDDAAIGAGSAQAAPHGELPADATTGFARWPEANRAQTTAPPETGGPPGILDLRTRSGTATVYEGERRLGTTPLQVELPSGRHVLSLRPARGGPPQELTVDIRSEHTSFHNVALLRRPSSAAP
ncbi:MAG: protein kinase [Deltaproteobacteria bacterium]|nr:protein kinase [Deltaproteobacteria bacterium]